MLYGLWSSGTKDFLCISTLKTRLHDLRVILELILQKSCQSPEFQIRRVIGII